MRLFCFGFGYAAESLARRLSARTSALAGTRTGLDEAGNVPLVRSWRSSKATPTPSARSSGGRAHVLVTVPPDISKATRCSATSARTSPTSPSWPGSVTARTVGVYGDWQGQWVDETSPPRPISERSCAAPACRAGVAPIRTRDGHAACEIFGSPHLWAGPQRLDTLKAGMARVSSARADFNRIHVDEHRQGAGRGHRQGHGHSSTNVSDDEPAPRRKCSPTRPSC